MNISNQTFPYENYIVVSKRISHLGFCSTSFFCTILIIIIVKFSNKNVGSYKYLMIIFSVLGTLFSIVEGILCPNEHSYTASWLLFITERPFGLSPDSLTLFLVLYAVLYAATICMLSVQFVYRYCAIFHQFGLKYFEGWRMLSIAVYCSGCGILWGGSMYLFSQVDDYAKAYLRGEMSIKYGINIDNLVAFTLVAYDKDGHFRWWNSIANFILCIIMFAQYAIMMFCAVVMYRKMEENMKMMSESLRRVHRQFFRTLVIQIIAPSIFLFSPLTFILYHPFLNYAISFPSGMFLCAISLFPAIDAIVILTIVREYRNAVKKIFRYACCRRKQNEVKTSITYASTTLTTSTAQ
ncbi:Seven TM Receptor [Caenorhabditis elegans]|uniref:Seven TM Receptor n=1 Tax=Caenorhabditis elegans TaxID=6239 RepID=O17363_CAEEL|nr:Seven TM Receptor [Caenorhabditis elegans]CCD63234.1 Seven TM Receptor [Caenorhabditis elegans]|eukprot:NP_503316.1 Seven TM Receptor [Caenorhabditis elegans]